MRQCAESRNRVVGQLLWIFLSHSITAAVKRSVTSDIKSPPAEFRGLYGHSATGSAPRNVNTNCFVVLLTRFLECRRYVCGASQKPIFVRKIRGAGTKRVSPACRSIRNTDMIPLSPRSLRAHRWEDSA